MVRTSEVIPVLQEKLALGTWQGVFLFEHRRESHTKHEGSRREVLPATGHRIRVADGAWGLGACEIFHKYILPPFQQRRIV
jgi:hypothetical protein